MEHLKLPKRDHPDYANIWYALNKEHLQAYKRKRYKKNIDKARKERAEYDKKNQAAKTAREAKRRAVKLKATLDGYDTEIKEVYLNCPKGYHVDHIIPLKGKEVCGLHVPWNLQYLTAEENLRKSNKV
jgi:hypothetical protein